MVLQLPWQTLLGLRKKRSACLPGQASSAPFQSACPPPAAASSHPAHNGVNCR